MYSETSDTYGSLSVIKRCPLLGGSLTKIVTFGTKHFVHYSGPLLGGFTVKILMIEKHKVPNSRVTTSSYETELRKMTSHFELLTRKFL